MPSIGSRKEALRYLALAVAVALLGGFAYGRLATDEVADEVAEKPAEVAVEESSTSSSKPSEPTTYAAPAPAPVTTAVGTTSSVDPAAAISGEFIPPQPAPGSQREFDPENAPVVPKGVSAEQYIKDYYAAVEKTDWAKASKMLPDVTPGESVEDFKGLQYGYELQSFNVLTAVPNDEGAAAMVVHITKDNGVWNTIWTFLNTDRGLVVKDLVWSRPGGAGCH